MKNQSLNQRKKRALTIIKILRKATKDMPPPMSELIAQKYHRNPFLILISCLLSLRAQDVVTYPISVALFKQAKTPEEFLKMPMEKLEKIIYSTGFYKNKAKSIRTVSKTLLEKFHGKVPHTKEELLSIKGIGIKTASLVLGVAFGIPAICVDTHVHKLSNKLGIVHTKTPAQTEKALEEVIPKQYWIEYNKLFVTCGQHMKECKPYIAEYLK